MLGGIFLLKLLLRWMAIVAFFVVMLLVPAGTIDRPEGWWFLLLYITFSLVTGTYLLKNNPQLLAERLRVEKRPGKGWESVILLAIGALFIAGFVVSGLDVRFHWSTVPMIGEVIGFVGIACSWALIFLVLKENAFASRIVEVTEGQKVVSAGPYRVVRHPMYVGGIGFLIFTPFALGSLCALAPMGIAAALFVVRTALEDDTLQRELRGYAEYSRKVRYRLLPGLW